MSANTTIEWATKSWNPVRGCSRVSPGCDNCYAMKFAHRFSGAGKPYEGLTVLRPKTAKRPGVDWTGVARFIPDALDEPLRWKKPERVFVNSMSDLFHHTVSDEQIASVFAIMWRCYPRHQFLILTKRADRMLDLTSRMHTDRVVQFGKHAGMRLDDISWLKGRAWQLANAKEPGRFTTKVSDWPLPNVWLGVSCENQEAADERIPLLLKCPAAVRWVSAEPLLGPLEITQWRKGSHQDINGDPFLHWVVMGGESGPGARPLNVEWIRDLVTQCRESGAAPYVKQFGAKPYDETAHVRDFYTVSKRKGGELTDIPGDWPREFPVSQARAAE